MNTMDNVEVIVDNGSPVIIKPINQTGGETKTNVFTIVDQKKPEQQSDVMSQEELISFQQYINSDHFKNKVLEVSKEKGVSPVTLAKGFVDNTLGTIADTGISAVTTVEEFIDNITDVIAGCIKGTNKTFANLTKNTIRTVTLGKSTK